MKTFCALTVETIQNGISTTEKFRGKDLPLFRLNGDWYCFHRYNKVFNSVIITDGLTIEPEKMYYVILENYKGTLHEVAMSDILVKSLSSNSVSIEGSKAETTEVTVPESVIDVDYKPTLAEVAVTKNYNGKKPLTTPFTAIKNTIGAGIKNLKGKVRGRGDSSCHIKSEITDPGSINSIVWNDRYNRNGYYVGIERTLTFGVNHYTIVLKVDNGLSKRVYRTNMTFRSLEELHKKFPYTFKEYNSYDGGKILNVIISNEYKNNKCLEDTIGNRTTVTENTLAKLIDKFD